MRHRIILNFEAERKGMTTDDAIKALLKMSRENQEESKGSKSLKSVIYICVSLIAVYLVGIFQVYPRLAGTQFLAHPLNLLYFFGLIPGLAIALALATLLYTKSTDELLWAKWLLAIPLLIRPAYPGMDSSRCINWGGSGCSGYC